MKKDTIAAIATAMSNSGIGIVRISGEESIDIVRKIYKGKELTDHSIHYGYILDGKETIDEVLVMILKGPHSFTGEDTVEINCHGGSFVTRSILSFAVWGSFSRQTSSEGSIYLGIYFFSSLLTLRSTSFSLVSANNHIFSFSASKMVQAFSISGRHCAAFSISPSSILLPLSFI